MSVGLKTIGFVGGSVPAGVGYLEGKESLSIYPNRVQSHGYNTINLGKAGANNSEIFLTSLRLILESTCNIVVVEWNSFYRFRFHMSPETMLYIGTRTVSPPDGYAHCQPLSKSDLNNFQRLLILTNHEYHNILQLLEYCWILESTARLNNTKLVMLNGYTPWTSDLFDAYTDDTDLAQALGDFAKEILDFDNRNDEEILALLRPLHDNFARLDKDIWVNTFDQFNNFTVDSAPLDSKHPGPNSHKKIADMVMTHLNKREIL
jgi:hypothetical protein